MKRLLFLIAFILCNSVFFACKKDKYELADNISLLSFSLEPSANPGLAKSTPAIIEGKDVYIRVPNSIDIKAAVPSFTTDRQEVVGFIGTQVVESGLTSINLESPSVLRLNSPNSISEYNLIGLKNASILTFGFYAEDNEGKLFKDYTGTITKLDVQVDLPVDADITALTARFTLSNGASVKYKGAAFVSGQSVADYSEPIELELIDDEMTQPEIFTVTVGRLTAPVWSEMNLPDFLSVNSSAATLEINPISYQPYVMLQQSGGDRKAVMGYYDVEDKTWKAVGAESGFSAGRIDGVSFTFSNSGEPYAAYKDYTPGVNEQYGSLLKYSNNQWNYVGPQQGTFNRVNYLSLQLDENNIPYLGYLFPRAASPYPNRGTYIESFSNNVWKGTTLPQSTTGYYSKMVKGRDGKLYYVTMDLTAGAGVRKPSVYKLDNGTWKLVGQVLVGPNNSTSGGFNIDLDADENGELYLIYQSNNPAYVTYVMHWDGQRWAQLGDGFPQTTSSSANRDNVAIRIHPDGRIFVAFGDANNGVKVTTFNTDTGNWNTPSQLTTANGNKFELRISEQGIPYLITIIDSKPALFKYDIPGQ
ncbi:hypothetical protein SAMN05660841_00369 [Sphingobacterium nematocida]|uniref:Uncharacterized protein n=1 Tax=Sphingobacterium nematocida TaxID=1513896 RepID=A0A1T5B104_9SPHI|nr:hypothetical protein [Sphingobacterium nematocida]SKB40926.1 hypothetical protein SAMN05660841_00369 [Sphingobacterium nematocida]